MRTLSDRFLIKSMKSNRSLKVRIQVVRFLFLKNPCRDFPYGWMWYSLASSRMAVKKNVVIYEFHRYFLRQPILEGSTAKSIFFFSVLCGKAEKSQNEGGYFKIRTTCRRPKKLKYLTNHVRYENSEVSVV